MAQLPHQRQRWTPPAARLEGDRILKARAAQQRVRDAAVQAEAEAKVALAQEEKVLGEKVDDLEKTVETLIKDIPKIMPAAGGGRRTVKKILDKYYNLPNGLGSAAGNDTEDFATAAQGVKADSAVQPGDLAQVATTGSQDDMADGTTNKNFTATEQTKLAGIEAGADVTDATNVAAAGAVMEADTTTASMGFVLDEDDFTSNSATKLPSQQSVKANIDRRAPKARFKTPADLLQDSTSVGYSGKTHTVTTGDEITAGDHRYLVAASGAADHHLVTKGGVKLYVQIGKDGAFHAGAFGLIADNTSRLLSAVYSTLADAQAAYPLCYSNGYLDALTYEIDEIAMQEAILRAEGTTGLPAVQFGFGIAKATRRLRAGGTNKGIVLTGGVASLHQGSTAAGFTLNSNITLKTEVVASTAVDTTNNTITVAQVFENGQPITFSTSGTLPSPLVAGTVYFAIYVDNTTIKVAATSYDTDSGHQTVINLSTQGTGNHTITLNEAQLEIAGSVFEARHIGFWNAGNASNAIHTMGPNVSSGSGNLLLDHISVIEASGMNPYGEAAIKLLNGIDYSRINKTYYAGTSPKLFLVDGGGLSAGGTSRLHISETVANAVGSVGCDLFTYTNGSAEHISLTDNTMNFKNGTGGGSIVNISSLSGAQHVDSLYVSRAEFDIGSAGTATNRRVAKLKNVNTAHFCNSTWADKGDTTCLFELDNDNSVNANQTTNLHLSDVTTRSINGPVVKCTHGFPVEKVTVSGRINMISTAGLTDSSYGSGKIAVTQAASAVLDGINSNQGANTVYEMEITAAGTATTWNIRVPGGSPTGYWKQGQEFEIHLKNTSGSAYTNCAFGTTFKMLPSFTLTSLPTGQTAILAFRIEYTGSAFIARQIRAQLNTTT